MVPVEDADTVGLPLRQIVGQIVSDSGPEQRRDPSDRGQVVLVHVVQYLYTAPSGTLHTVRGTQNDASPRSFAQNPMYVFHRTQCATQCIPQNTVRNTMYSTEQHSVQRKVVHRTQCANKRYPKVVRSISIACNLGQKNVATCV